MTVFMIVMLHKFVVSMQKFFADPKSFSVVRCFILHCIGIYPRGHIGFSGFDSFHISPRKIIRPPLLNVICCLSNNSVEVRNNGCCQ